MQSNNLQISKKKNTMFLAIGEGGGGDFLRQFGGGK